MTSPSLDRPTLDTARVRLRPYTLDDVPAMVAGCSPREVAVTTLALPHPYGEQDAIDWVTSHPGRAERGESLELAITDRATGVLMGGLSLRVDATNQSGEIGYLVYLEHQGRGVATEAARALVTYAFDKLGLNRVDAHCFAENIASARVLEKCGMQFEGLMRERIMKWGEAKDLRLYAVLRRDRDPEKEG